MAAPSRRPDSAAARKLERRQDDRHGAELGQPRGDQLARRAEPEAANSSSRWIGPSRVCRIPPLSA